jgi:hypothetical protein
VGSGQRCESRREARRAAAVGCGMCCSGVS